MAKVGKFCLAKRVKVEWLFQVGLHRFRGRFRIGAGLGHFQDEFEIR